MTTHCLGGLADGSSYIGHAGLGIPTGHGQTMVFTVLTLSQLGHVLAIRSERDSLFSQGVFSNRPLFFVVLLTIGLQMSTIYVPWLNQIFKTQPLTLIELVICFAMSSIVFIGVELEKWARRRGWISKEAADG